MRRMKQSEFVLKADKLLKLGKFEEAKDLLLKAVKKEPNNPEVYYYLGEALCKLSLFDEAIVALQKADLLLPRHPRIYHLLGWVVFMNKDILAGRAFMEMALRADPDNSKICADLAVLEMNDRRYDVARNYIARGKKISPNDELFDEIELMIDKMERLSESLLRGKN